MYAISMFLLWRDIVFVLSSRLSNMIPIRARIWNILASAYGLEGSASII